MAYTCSNCCSTRCFNRDHLNSECMEFCTSNNKKDMHIDLYACPPKGPVIWGNVYDNNGRPIKDSLVRLVKCEESCSSQSLVICQTRSDRNGYYELELPVSYKGKYRIVINSSVSSEETMCKCKNSIYYF